MPTPTNKQFPLMVQLSGTNLAAGMTVRAYNRNTKEFSERVEIIDQSSNDYIGVIDLGNMTTAVTKDDIIEVMIDGGGKVEGTITHTVDLTKGGAKVTLTVTDTNTSTPAISL